MPFQYSSSLRIVFDAELKKGQLTQQIFSERLFGCCEDKKINKSLYSKEATHVSKLSPSYMKVYNTHGRTPPPSPPPKKSISRVMPVSYLTF